MTALPRQPSGYHTPPKNKPPPTDPIIYLILRQAVNHIALQ